MALRARFPNSFDLLLAKLLGVVRFGAWIRGSEIDRVRQFSSRFDLYEYVAGEVGNVPIQYLEFGVYRGESFAKWLELSRHPDSTFDGFDSFEGLPEEWKHLGAKNVIAKGHFSTQGATPPLADPRLRWHKGWFWETLPGFMSQFRPTYQLVVNIDCDLYSSTLYVLSLLSPVLSGSIMIFDELSHVDHEFRAVSDFCAAFGRSYQVIGVTSGDFLQVAVRWNGQGQKH
jgi:hypothetical protein